MQNKNITADLKKLMELAQQHAKPEKKVALMNEVLIFWAVIEKLGNEKLANKCGKNMEEIVTATLAGQTQIGSVHGVFRSAVFDLGMWYSSNSDKSEVAKTIIRDGTVDMDAVLAIVNG